jgi:O-antigen/teichoic acid export membrane protein
MSLIKQSGIYVFGRTLPAAIAVGAVAIYTRLIDPASFGRYALLLASAVLAASVAFSWLRAAAFRIAAGQANELEPDFARTVGSLFVLMAFGVAIFEYVFLRITIPTAPMSSVYLAVVATVVSGWNELNGSMLQARLSVVAWGLLNFARAGCALLSSLGLIALGFKTNALLGGFIIGNCTALFSIAMWRSAISGSFDRQLFRRIVLFGWPASATAAVAQVAPTFQRYVLTAFAGAGAVGVYAVSQDFALQSMSVLISSVSLAGIPLAFKAKDLGGTAALTIQMRENARLIFAVGFPAAVALAVLAGPISETLLGGRFQSGAGAIIALISISTLLSCLRTYYFDQAFELAYETRPQAVIALVGTGAVLATTMFFVPRFGAIGAGYASLATAVISIAMSIVWGPRILRLPIPWRSAGKTVLATAGMVATMLAFPRHGVIFLVLAFAAGFAVYLAVATLTRPTTMRARFGNRFAWRDR